MSEVHDLVVVGAGGFARETATMVRESGGAVLHGAAPGARVRLLGLLDDDPALHGTDVEGVPVLGGTGLVRELPDALVAVCVGSPSSPWSRARVVARLGLPAGRYATLVHPTAVVPGTCELGPGTVVHAYTVCTTAVRVGPHVSVMPHAVLTHDDDVGAFATICAGVRLAGGVRVGTGAYLGAGALVRERLAVGPWALVGMGAVVTRDVPAAEVWAGVPAIRVRAAAVPGDVPGDVLGDVPKGAPGGALGGVTGDVPGGVGEDVPGGVPRDVPGDGIGGAAGGGTGGVIGPGSGPPGAPGETYDRARPAAGGAAAGPGTPST